MRRLLLPLLWVALVATISLTVWSAIRSAGTQISSDAEETVVIEPLPAPVAESPKPTKKAKPKPTRPPATPSGSPTSPGQPTTPSTRPSPRASTAGVTRLWHGPAGSVVSECRGSLIRLKGANPNSGWRVSVERNSREIEVKFERAESEVEVHARCSGGAPVYEASAED